MPEPLLTVAQFREMFSEIDTSTPEPQIRRPLGVALRRIKSWVGETVYSAAVEADDEDDCKNDLQFAAGYLAMHFLVANVNTVIRPGGVAKTEKVEGDVTISYLTPDDTIKRAQEFFDLADEACRPWKLAEVSPLIGIVCDE